MITISILNIIMTLGIMQYSLERRHPKFVIAIELLIILSSASVLLLEFRTNHKKGETGQRSSHQIYIDSVYHEGYKKGLFECNKK